MAKRAVHAPLELNTQGISLTDFAQAICFQEQLEVSLIRLPITVQQVPFPLCLVAASGLRPQVRPRLGDIPACHFDRSLMPSSNALLISYRVALC